MKCFPNFYSRTIVKRSVSRNANIIDDELVK